MYLFTAIDKCSTLNVPPTAEQCWYLRIRVITVLNSDVFTMAFMCVEKASGRRQNNGDIRNINGHLMAEYSQGIRVHTIVDYHIN